MGFMCPTCMKSYATKYSRDRHVLSTHGDVLEDSQSSLDCDDEHMSESEESHVESTTTTNDGEEEESQELLVTSGNEHDPIIELARDAESQKQFRELVARKIYSCKELKISKVYKELKDSVEKYIDNGYDLEEAVLSTVRKRKYLLNRIYKDQLNDSEEESVDDDGEGEEQM